ncbi:MAG: sugar ABC transporter substrate-binding protein, partial [Lachnospiraceae bacterium]|nr:sugar ABC transporter substrate-binding protein [Lachnospiraceae bacterium]
MKKKVLKALLCIAMAAAMVMGCTSEKAPEGESGSKGEASEDNGSGKVFMTVSNQQNEFMVGMGESFKEVGKTAGYDVQLMDADLDAAKQVSQIETAIAEGAEAILIEPCSVDGLTSGLEAAHEAGIPLFIIHNNVSAEDLITSLIHVDVQQGGELKMEQVMKDIGGKGDIAIMTGTLGQDTTNQICGGYDKVLDA